MHRTTELDLASLEADANPGGLAGVYLHHVLDQYFERAAAFLAEDWSPEWRQASEFSGWQIEATPDGLRALSGELRAVIERHAGNARPAPSGAAAVHIQLQTFPRRRQAP